MTSAPWEYPHDPNPAKRPEPAAYSRVPMLRPHITHPARIDVHGAGHAVHDHPINDSGQSGLCSEPTVSTDRGQQLLRQDIRTSVGNTTLDYACGALTSDNPPLSEVTLGESLTSDHRSLVKSIANFGDSPFRDLDLTCEAADLLRHSLAPNTERAYRADLSHFRDWGGALPASASTICAYIGDQAGRLSVATIQRRIATLSKAHEAAGVVNACRSEVVKAALRGLRRKHGIAQRQARPLLRDDLFRVLDSLGDTLRDQRDRALLLLGFAGGFRRSELVALERVDVEVARQGLIVTIRRSKTDQESEGRRIGIPHGRTRHCPTAAVEAWLVASGISDGPLFRPITRHGHLGGEALTGDAVSILLRERLCDAGIDPGGYSGHSLRAGFATSAAQAGVSALKIRQQTGHASDAMLARYIREGELFMGNAAGMLL